MLPKPTNRDTVVWSLVTQGYAEEEIAGTLRITTDEVKSALMRVHSYKARVSHEMVDMVINSELLSVARSGSLRTALDGALTAKRILVSSQGVVTDPITGEPISEPDHAMRIEGAKTLGKLIRDIRPNSPAVVANIQNNNSNTQNIIGGGRSFEARRRAAAERRGAVAVADAEEVDEADTEEVLEGEDVDVELDDPDDVSDDDTEDDGE